MPLFAASCPGRSRARFSRSSESCSSTVALGEDVVVVVGFPPCPAMFPPVVPPLLEPGGEIEAVSQAGPPIAINKNSSSRCVGRRRASDMNFPSLPFVALGEYIRIRLRFPRGRHLPPCHKLNINACDCLFERLRRIPERPPQRARLSPGPFPSHKAGDARWKAL